jgi:hypothetical protein
MTPEELAAIEARANSATPGPWMITNDGGLIVKSDAGFVCDFARGTGTHAHDADFIATARTDVPLLLAEVKRLIGFDRDWREIHASTQTELGQLLAKLKQIEAECQRVAERSLLGAQAVNGVLEIVRR